jgi:hypothetical protein
MQRFKSSEANRGLNSYFQVLWLETDARHNAACFSGWMGTVTDTMQESQPEWRPSFSQTSIAVADPAAGWLEGSRLVAR